MVDIKEATLPELATALAAADAQLDLHGEAVKTLRLIVPELLRRLAGSDHLPPNDQGGDVVVVGGDGTEVTVTAVATDRYDPFVATRTVAIHSSMSPYEIRQMVRNSEGQVERGTRVVVHGVVEGMWVGGGHAHAISNEDGTPVGDLEFVGQAASRIDGLKIGDNKGGCEGEIRFRSLNVRADDRDVEIEQLLDEVGVPTGEYLIHKEGEEDAVLVDLDEAHSDGDSQGDFAPIRLLDHMPDMHLILEAVRITVDKAWLGYAGFGIKWACFVKTCRLTVNGLVADAAREHTFYFHNTVDAWIEAAENLFRDFTDLLGVTRKMGNGRTFEQSANRVPQTYPKGGLASTGRIVLKGCIARMCGWEGVLPWRDSGGSIHAGGKAGGGSDFTNHGHTGELWAVYDCKSISPYCGTIAVWNETSKKNVTADNPMGYRGWMVDNDNLEGNEEVFNPLIEAPDGIAAYGTRRVEIVNFEQTGTGNRRMIQVSGTQELYVRGVTRDNNPVNLDTPDDFRVNHQAGAAAVLLVDVA